MKVQLLIIPAASAALLLCASAWAQTTTRVSVSSSGVQANFGGFHSSISADLRYIAFDSASSNLVTDDTNGKSDIFLRDRLAGTTERISLSYLGTQGNSGSWTPSMTADARYVVFAGSASNLVPLDSNTTVDVFLRDLQTGVTELVSIGTNGTQGNDWSDSGSISSDGRLIAFLSDSNNLVPADTNGVGDVFLRDRQLGTTERLSVSSSGIQGNGVSLSVSLSADGRFVAFGSSAGNLVPGDTNLGGDIFVRDLQAGTITRVSVNPGGAQGNGISETPSISADGNWIAFMSSSSTYVAADTNGARDIFVSDRLSGAMQRVSVDSSGTQGNGNSRTPTISADGRFVVFVSSASNLVPGDTNLVPDVFVHDRTNGTTVRVSVDSGGAQANGGSDDPSISADGRCLAFWSDATNFIAGDTNNSADVFAFDRCAVPAIYCTAKLNSLGCTPTIAASGCSSSSQSNGFVVTASLVRNNKPGLLLYGVSGRAATPFQAGFLCLAPPVKRGIGANSGGAPLPADDCSGVLSIDMNSFAAGAIGGNPLPALAVQGTIVECQWWGRDPGFPAPNNTTLSNALEYIVGS